MGGYKNYRGQSYWWGWQDLNLRPSGYEPPALTTELHPHILNMANRDEYSRFL
jgi:hypothetical protein